MISINGNVQTRPTSDKKKIDRKYIVAKTFNNLLHKFFGKKFHHKQNSY